MNARVHASNRLLFARRLALVPMLLCLIAFAWSLVLFPATAETDLEFIRPQNNWTDSVLLSTIKESGFTVGSLAYLHLGVILFPTFFYLAVAAIIYARHSTDWFSLYLSVLFVIFGTVANNLSRLAGNLHPAMGIILSALGNGGWIGLFPVFYLFPDGRFVPRWTRWMMVLWAAFAVLLLLSILGPARGLGELLNVIGIPIVILIFVVAAGSQVYRYLNVSNPVQRQQTKWVLIGIVMFVVAAAISLGRIALSQPGQSFTVDDLRIEICFDIVFGLVGAFFPITIGIAILRYRLWDIDFLIRRTLIYSILTTMLALFYFGSIVVLQQIFRSLTGAGDDLAIIVSTLAIAALFNPMRHRVQAVIDQRFYRHKYDAQKVLERFAITARDEVELEKLNAELLNVVSETMQPTKVSLWLKSESEVKR